jgi:hypothetical protein
MQKDINPEERLLRLIRNKNKEGSGSTSAVSQTSLSDKSKYISKLFQKQILQRLAKDFFQNIFSLKKLKLFLISLIIIFLGYGVFELFFFREGSVEHLKSAGKIDLKPEIKEVPLPQPSSFDYYANKMNKRDIFTPSFVQEQSVQSPYQAQIANLRLTGIVVDKQPQAIIEDTKLKKTYFLYKGDYIADMRVEEISESKVILSYSGERFELVP